MLTFRWTALPNNVKEPIENDLSLSVCFSSSSVKIISTPQTNVIHWVLQMYIIFNTKTSMHNKDAIPRSVAMFDFWNEFRFLLENHLTLFLCIWRVQLCVCDDLKYLNVQIDDFKLQKSQLENVEKSQQLNKLEHSVYSTRKCCAFFSSTSFSFDWYFEFVFLCFFFLVFNRKSLPTTTVQSDRSQWTESLWMLSNGFINCCRCVFAFNFLSTTKFVSVYSIV